MRLKQPEVLPHGSSELKKRNGFFEIRRSTIPGVVRNRSRRPSIRLEDVIPDTNYHQHLDIDNEIQYQEKHLTKFHPELNLIEEIKLTPM